MVMVRYVAPRVTSCHITLSPLKLNLAWERGEVGTERDLDTLLSPPTILITYTYQHFLFTLFQISVRT